MSNRRDHLARYIALGAFFVTVCLIFIARLINIQVAGQDYYTETLSEDGNVRTVKIQAQRGCIYDSQGRELISNSYSYDLYLDAGSIPSGLGKNETVLWVLRCAKDCGVYDTCFAEPDHPFVNKDGKWALDEEYMSSIYGKRMNRLMTDLNFEPDKKDSEDAPVTWNDTDISEVRRTLRERYGLVDEDGKEQYSQLSDGERELLFKIRLDMELKYFSTAEPYTILHDVTVPVITAVKEGNVRGVEVSCRAERVYNYPDVAAHLLGRTGKITAETADYYTEQGYPLDAIVGISGVEQAFEKYLHGTDGELTVVEDEYGNTVDSYVSVEPVPGQDVYLTIDIEFQRLAEKALENNINLIVNNAKEKIAQNAEETLMGEDASSGALTAIDRKTGAVLALASYPTYNLATFKEDYDTLKEDKNLPMFFRALEGTYAPGSTFKPGVAAAALSENIITPYTEIVDEGVYKFYESSQWQPKCWIYTPRYGMQTHGAVNVSKAIQVSCNYFFYDVGRQLTISKMNEYCSAYGLGEATGIELNEKTGILASPKEREDKGGTWYDGDTLAAAIGQSDNLFNPLQMSCYLATLLNNGTRYSAHILKEVRSYKGEVTYTAEPKTLSQAKLTAEAVTTVKYAMKDVTENGSAARVFVNYPVAIGGKTGTAQVSTTSSDNAIFTAFAPFDDPTIVATCVIEHGASGTDAGFAVRDVFSAYFGVGQTENKTDAAAKTDGGGDGNEG